MPIIENPKFTAALYFLQLSLHCLVKVTVAEHLRQGLFVALLPVFLHVVWGHEIGTFGFRSHHPSDPGSGGQDQALLRVAAVLHVERDLTTRLGDHLQSKLSLRVISLAGFACFIGRAFSVVTAAC